jgi:hypothetical protein
MIKTTNNTDLFEQKKQNGYQYQHKIVNGSHDYATTNQNALPWMSRLFLTSRETRL